ncbi:MAG: RND family transporter [Candidatus Zixiibacteriota bacterium]
MRTGLTTFSIDHPWLVILIATVVTLGFGWQFPSIVIDTDPENMLPADEPARLFDSQTKDEFDLADFIAVGVVVDEGAFTPDLLNRIYRITSEIEQIDGVIVDDILAPSTVDDISQAEAGIAISLLMEDKIETQGQADHIFSRIMNNPMLRGKLASEDGKAIAMFVPIESKDISARIAGEIGEIIDEHGGGASFHIAGLPVAEDSFGAEMFTQMAVSAPVAMLILFLLMLMFFRNVRLVLAPIMVAMMSVMWAMGLLIMTGNSVHIMSSMIPIFLIPIAVLDAIHILSEFQDNFGRSGERRSAMQETIRELFVPMLFTSVTTIAGFASLALTPIPPVRVFGLFVAFGIAVAWLLSLTIIPAIAMLNPQRAMVVFGRHEEHNSLLATTVRVFRNAAARFNKLIIAAAVLVIFVSAYGLTLIEVNDNPVKWFKPSHPIRIADAVMNDHLAGTYMNYLVFEGIVADQMKSPELLHYVERLQRELEKDAVVGGTTGLTDIVSKVRYELFGADSSQATIPDNADEVAQMLFLFEMSGGDPDDLFKFVTPDYTRTNLWVQLKDGDNRRVQQVVDRAQSYMDAHPLPDNVSAQWAGLPYINIVWQQKMVTGMQKSLLGSFAVVLIMMIFLFRSIRWGLVSILPLSITILAIYAFIGYIGRPYDMPVAVLSSLTLGLSIDFSIHFIQRLRAIHKKRNDFAISYDEIFESTGRAIARNVLVIAIGFVPMLFSSLVPYITVGSFFLAIMIVSGSVTMLLLPAIVKLFHRSLLPTKGKNS